MVTTTVQTSPFFRIMPDDATRNICAMLQGDLGDHVFPFQRDDRSVISTEHVCKEWQENAVLSEERSESKMHINQMQKLRHVHHQFKWQHVCREVNAFARVMGVGRAGLQTAGQMLDGPIAPRHLGILLRQN